MPSIKSKLATLRRKAARDDLEVEHLTEFAVLGDAAAVPVLRELHTVYKWPRKKPPPVPATTQSQLRTFLHAVVRQKLSEKERGTVVCALRGVGNDESIELISNLPKFGGSWKGLELSAGKAIRKRLRQLVKAP